MAKCKKDQLEETKRLMGALLRMPPKQHEDMKVHRPKRRKAKPSKAKEKRDDT